MADPKTSGDTKKVKEPTKKKNDDSYEDDEDQEPEEELTEEEKVERAEKNKRIIEQLEADYKQKQEFERNLKNVTLQTFKDKPEEVRSLRCVYAEANMLALEWDPPGSNNCTISEYHVYMSKTKIPNVNSSKF